MQVSPNSINLLAIGEQKLTNCAKQKYQPLHSVILQTSVATYWHRFDCIFDNMANFAADLRAERNIAPDNFITTYNWPTLYIYTWAYKLKKIGVAVKHRRFFIRYSFVDLLASCKISTIFSAKTFLSTIFSVVDLTYWSISDFRWRHPGLLRFFTTTMQLSPQLPNQV